MNQTFNLKRFATYLKYDLVSARNNFGLSLLIISLMPLWSLICYEMISIISGHGFSEGNAGLQISSVMVAMIMLVLTAPVKLYGKVTDKKEGSAFLMIPASTFEKFFSMLLISCLILPVVGGVILLGSDALISAIVPGYGSPVISNISSAMDYLTDSEIYISPSLLWVGWCQNILTFTLGAIFFKRGKIGKTFLCVMGLGMILVSLMVLIFSSTNISTEQLIEWFGNPTPEKFQQIINLTISIIYIVVFTILLGGIYLRLKTLKH